MIDESGRQGAGFGAGDWGGPYLAAAFLCERVLNEKDEVQSAIRIVDRFFQSLTSIGGQPPATMLPLAVNLQMLLIFKAGQARGRQSVRVTLEEPSGLRVGLELTQPVLFEGEDRGVSLTLAFGLQLTREGLYWFHVCLDDRLVTKVPLRVVYQPIAAQGPLRAG